MKKTLFERGLKVKLLYDYLISQSETPHFKSYDGGKTGDIATLEIIKRLYNARGVRIIFVRIV